MIDNESEIKHIKTNAITENKIKNKAKNRTCKTKLKLKNAIENSKIEREKIKIKNTKINAKFKINSEFKKENNR